mmetsp:Transcript_8019/g.29636  ORF Transcript_8019/g.29636 Transcript_8019/m.29636 type:complete len:217 (-) Transcript_8019:508-1158(-)
MTYGYEGTTALGASDQIRPCCRSTLPSKPTTMPMLSLAKSTPRTFGSGTILARPLFPRAIISLRVPVAVFSNRYSRFIPRQIPLLEVHSMTRGVSGTGTSFTSANTWPSQLSRYSLRFTATHSCESDGLQQNVEAPRSLDANRSRPVFSLLSRCGSVLSVKVPSLNDNSISNSALRRVGVGCCCCCSDGLEPSNITAIFVIGFAFLSGTIRRMSRS